MTYPIDKMKKTIRKRRLFLVVSMLCDMAMNDCKNWAGRPIADVVCCCREKVQHLVRSAEWGVEEAERD